MELGLGLTKIIPLFIYAGGLVVILLTLFYRIEIGIYFLIPLLPLQNILDHITKYPLGKDFIDIFFLVLLIKWMLNGKSPKIKWNQPADTIIVFIVIWTFFELIRGSVFLGETPIFSPGNDRFVTWKNYIMLPLLYFIVVNNIKDTKQIKIILILMAFAMLFMGRNFYHNFNYHDHSHYRHDLRVEGTFSYLGPNELAVFYAQNTIILVCLFLYDKNSWRKLLFLGTLIFNTYCIVFLYSRGGYLATFVSWAYLGFVKNRKLLFVMIVALIFWRSLTPVSVQERIDMTRTEDGFDSSIQDRYVMWEQAGDILKDNLILGVGYNTVPHLGIYAARVRKSLHNGYLEIAVEQGIIGLFLYLVFFFQGIRYGWKLYKISPDPFFKGFGLGFIGCILAILTGNIAGSYWFYMNVSGFFWTNLALVIIATRIAESEKTPEKEMPKPDFKENTLIPSNHKVHWVDY